MSELLASLRDAIEERTGLISSTRRVLDLPAPHGSRLRIGLTGALFGTLAVVLASGLALALHYSPSTTHAWASVTFIERELPFGRLIRALHYQGTNVLVVGLALQLLIVALQGAHRRPREASWWLSLVTLGLLLASAMTGALLPWDEQGYWASRVETGIMASAPIVGPLVRELAQGGNDFGHLMLTRYYALHAVLLPLVLLGVTLMQWRLFARLGPAPIESRPPAEGSGLAPLVVMIGIVVGALVVYGLAQSFGAPLEGPADPSGGYPPRPAWYFRALYELRRHFEGPLEPVATMLIPGVATLFLVFLPLLDRADRPGRRWLTNGLLALGLGLIVFATWVNFRRDEQDTTYQRMQAQSVQRRDKAFLLAANGVPPEGPLFMIRNTPEEKGRRIYAERCSGCHGVGEPIEKPKGPDLAGWGGESWLAGCIRQPGSPDFFGLTKVNSMDSYESLGDERIRLLAEFLAALKHHDGLSPDELPPDLQPGRKAFEMEGCDNCHSLTGDEASGAPTLQGYASDRWIKGLLMDPDGEHFFGEDNDMPSYRGKLDDQQVGDLIAYLRTLESKPPKAGAAPQPQP